MAITVQSADNVLKSVYLDVISEQLNTKINPFLAQINKNSNDVVGKEVKKRVLYDLNGGVGAGTEEGDLPKAIGNKYETITLPLKNFYGVIEISDKALRASEGNSGAFVNVLNSEMEGLIKASQNNFGRMLFGDGSGKISSIGEVDGENIFVAELAKFKAGMIVDFYNEDGQLMTNGKARKVIEVDYDNNCIKVEGENVVSATFMGGYVTYADALNNELLGLEAIFNDNETLYGFNKEENQWLKPVVSNCSNLSEIEIQKVIDAIEERTGEAPNMIICSFGVRRALQRLFAQAGTRINDVELAGGYKTISYNGIPIVVDRYCPRGSMYLLNTNDFELQQLCDWRWLEGEDGKILKQIPGKPIYTATLVKYAELLCSRPCGQGKISGIIEI